MLISDLVGLNKKYDSRSGLDRFFETASQFNCPISREGWSYQPSWNVSFNTDLSKSSDDCFKFFITKKNWKEEKGIIIELKENLRMFEKFLKFENYQEIFEYFIFNTEKLDDLIDVVYKIGKLKSKYFDNDTQLILCINHDPEINDKFLKFYVRKNHYSDDFMDKIDKLCDEYQNALIPKKIWVHVTTDFGRPI